MSAGRKPLKGYLSMFLVVVLYSNWAVEYYIGGHSFGRVLAIVGLGLAMIDVCSSIYRDRIA